MFRRLETRTQRNSSGDRSEEQGMVYCERNHGKSIRKIIKNERSSVSRWPTGDASNLFHMLVEGTKQDKDVPVIVLDEFAPSEIRSSSVLMNALPFLILGMRGLIVRVSQEESFCKCGDSPSFPLVKDELDVMQDFIDSGVNVIYLDGWDGMKQFVDRVTEFLQIPWGNYSKTATMLAQTQTLRQTHV